MHYKCCEIGGILRMNGFYCRIPVVVLITDCCICAAWIESSLNDDGHDYDSDVMKTRREMDTKIPPGSSSKGETTRRDTFADTLGSAATQY